MRSEERGDALAALAGGNTHIEGEGKEREDKEDKEDTVAEEVPLEKATQIRAQRSAPATHHRMSSLSIAVSIAAISPGVLLRCEQPVAPSRYS